MPAGRTKDAGGRTAEPDTASHCWASKPAHPQADALSTRPFQGTRGTGFAGPQGCAP